MLLLTNAQIVTLDEVFSGTLLAESGQITAVDRGRTNLPAAIDCDGDYLIPGLVDLHTDAFEKHYSPRAGVRWPSASAIFAHDANIAGTGITTVFDSLSMGTIGEDRDTHRELSRTWLQAMTSIDTTRLRSEHFLHSRLELPHPHICEAFLEVANLPSLRLVSLMDHTPGQGQYVNLEKWRTNNRLPALDAATEERVKRKRELHALHAAPNRERLAGIVRERGFVLASHDDRTVEEVERAARLGVTISEFPVTLEAAAKARELGLAVLMGGPNIVLGGSHSGNAAAVDVARNGWLDCLASDYVPLSMLHGAFLLAEQHGLSLPAAIAMVTAHPARFVHLVDRGSIAVGLRADLVRVRQAGPAPQPVAVWRCGVRVC